MPPKPTPLLYSPMPARSPSVRPHELRDEMVTGLIARAIAANPGLGRLAGMVGAARDTAAGNAWITLGITLQNWRAGEPAGHTVGILGELAAFYRALAGMVDAAAHAVAAGPAALARHDAEQAAAKAAELARHHAAAEARRAAEAEAAEHERMAALHAEHERLASWRAAQGIKV